MSEEIRTKRTYFDHKSVASREVPDLTAYPVVILVSLFSHHGAENVELVLTSSVIMSKYEILQDFEEAQF